MAVVDSNANHVAAAFQADFLWCRDIFFRLTAVSPMWSARQPKTGKGRTFTRHERRIQAAVSGIRAELLGSRRIEITQDIAIVSVEHWKTTGSIRDL